MTDPTDEQIRADAGALDAAGGAFPAPLPATGPLPWKVVADFLAGADLDGATVPGVRLDQDGATVTDRDALEAHIRLVSAQ